MASSLQKPLGHILNGMSSLRLGARPGCIARRGVGLAQRASLDYFDGIRTVVGSRAEECRWLIVQTAPRNEKILPGWTLIRETSRPGDRDERLRLYRRDK